MDQVSEYLAQLASTKRAFVKRYKLTNSKKPVNVIGTLVNMNGKLMHELGETICAKIADKKFIFLPAFSSDVVVPHGYREVWAAAKAEVDKGNKTFYIEKLGVIAMQVIAEVDPITSMRTPKTFPGPCPLTYKGFSVANAIMTSMKASTSTYDEGWVDNCIAKGPGEYRGVVSIRCELPKGGGGYQSVVVFNPTTKDRITITEPGFETTKNLFSFVQTSWDLAKLVFKSAIPPAPPSVVTPGSEAEGLLAEASAAAGDDADDGSDAPA